jgi:hypothetical protein
MSNTKSFFSEWLFLTPVDDLYTNNQESDYEESDEDFEGLLTRLNGVMEKREIADRKNSIYDEEVSTTSNSPVGKSLLFKHNLFECPDGGLINLKGKHVKLTNYLGIDWRATVGKAQESFLLKLLSDNQYVKGKPRLNQPFLIFVILLFTF